MEAPKRFKVGNQWHTTEIHDKIGGIEDSVFGEYDCCRCVVKVAESIVDDNGETVNLQEEQIKNSFWHEVFHVFNYYWNNEQDEALAQSFANFMCEFLESSNAKIVFE